MSEDTTLLLPAPTEKKKRGMKKGTKIGSYLPEAKSFDRAVRSYRKAAAEVKSAERVREHAIKKAEVAQRKMMRLAKGLIK